MRSYLYWIAALAAVLAGGLWSAARLADARLAAEQAAADLQSCRSIADRITRLRSNGVLAAAMPMDQAGIQQQGEATLTALGLPASHLVKVAPEMPRRIGRGSYCEMPTTLILRDVTLQETVGFLLNIADGPSPLRPRAIRLWGPQEAGGDVRWTVEVTLSYVMFQPAAESRIGPLEKEQNP